MRTYYLATTHPYPGAVVTAGRFDTRAEAERAVAGCVGARVVEVRA